MLGVAAALTLCLGDGGFLVSSSVVEDKQAPVIDLVADVCDVRGWRSRSAAVRIELGERAARLRGHVLEQRQDSHAAYGEQCGSDAE